MSSFLPIAVLGYALNGGSTIIDKILLDKSLPHPIVYTFFISVLGLLTLFLIPFGLNLNAQSVIFGSLAGIAGNLALITYFEGLKHGEASVVSPVVGALNPLFTLVLGAIFLNQVLNSTQYLAFFILILGAGILTLNMWFKIRLNKQLLMMSLSGLFFALGYLFLREAFVASNFVSGLVISRGAGGIVVTFFLISPKIRREIFSSRLTKHHFLNKTSLIMTVGQLLGAVGGTLITYGVFLGHPALVNSLFGVQYVVILVVAIILYERHSRILDETLSTKTLIQKAIAIVILSTGMYLLSK